MIDSTTLNKKKEKTTRQHFIFQDGCVFYTFAKRTKANKCAFFFIFP
jgi:hypothetical protein